MANKKITDYTTATPATGDIIELVDISDTTDDATGSSRKTTLNDLPLSSAATTALAGKQPLDSDLTTIAGLTPTTDNFMQSKSSAWASRTPTQVTADLNTMVGDSGAGGTKGLVPAPGAGDAAAGKFLKADGTFAVPSGGGGGGASKPRMIITDNVSSLADLSHPTFSTGVVTAGSSGNSAVIERGTTAGGSGFIQNLHLQYIMPIFDKNPTFFLSVDDGQFTAAQSYDVYMILGYAFGPGDALPAASYFKYFGFRMRNNAGTAELYSVHQDATHAEGSTSIGSGVSWGGNTHTMVADMSSGTNIKFYVDGTLLATHTTNLPSGVQAGGALYQIAAIGKTGTTNQTMATVNSMGVSYDAY